MINRDDIEAGDKVYTRDGGCLVARDDGDGNLALGTHLVRYGWKPNGSYLCYIVDHPLDIIRIEKAPKPVAEEVYVVYSGREWGTDCTASGYHKAIKLTIINGKLDKSEQVK
jgi:hypothetical protein